MSNEMQKMQTGATTLNEVEEKIITLRNEFVLLDSDVAALYEVQTKEINQAVKNNPRKFPHGYIFELDKNEVENLRSKSGIDEQTDSLRSKILTLEKQGRGKHTKYTPKAFTEDKFLPLHASFSEIYSYFCACNFT